MKISDIRLLKEAGTVMTLAAVRTANDEGWLLLVRAGEGPFRPLHTSRGQVRILKSLDVAHRVASEIGFDSFTVSRSEDSLES